ncbi:septum formation initiator family protein [Maridesulfovibrio ferrireducens]|uniref:Cell division protein FtsB n=1 Tax=Maridesulfovibrio ferrireducens TaxID=246191 RepID=A0A1G9LLP7_9BACT|nr:septum formation initiator family protein [Maridesulfovibrio ferrireducens]MBI9110156.1 septum formation initiator family protein [Maridesulfovibrio ferrireducens]SDL62939.1 cell division protein FtsB [Maridesulfovibrio ferrireducens]
MLRRRLLLGLLVLINVVLLLRLGLSEQGVFGYLELDRKVQELELKIEDADSRTLELSREIRRLKSDRAYQEKIIRSRMNYVKENELLYIFPDSGKLKPQGETSDAKQN